MRRRLFPLLVPLLLAAAGCGHDREDRHMLSDVDDPAFAEIGHDVRSPSGRFLLTVAQAGRDNRVTTIQVTVRDRDHRPLYTDPARYSINHTTLVCWADHTDQAWVYSGDIGTYLLLPRAGGWVERSWEEMGSPKAPAALRKARPTFFSEPPHRGGARAHGIRSTGAGIRAHPAAAAASALLIVAVADRPPQPDPRLEVG